MLSAEVALTGCPAVRLGKEQVVAEPRTGLHLIEIDGTTGHIPVGANQRSELRRAVWQQVAHLRISQPLAPQHLQRLLAVSELKERYADIFHRGHSGFPSLSTSRTTVTDRALILSAPMGRMSA